MESTAARLEQKHRVEEQQLREERGRLDRVHGRIESRRETNAKHAEQITAARRRLREISAKGSDPRPLRKIAESFEAVVAHESLQLERGEIEIERLGEIKGAVSQRCGDLLHRDKQLGRLIALLKAEHQEQRLELESEETSEMAILRTVTEQVDRGSEAVMWGERYGASSTSGEQPLSGQFDSRRELGADAERRSGEEARAASDQTALEAETMERVRLLSSWRSMAGAGIDFEYRDSSGSTLILRLVQDQHDVLRVVLDSTDERQRRRMWGERSRIRSALEAAGLRVREVRWG